MSIAPHSMQTDCLASNETMFDSLTGFPFTAHFVNTLPSFGAMRMAYIDQAPLADQAPVPAL